MKLTNTARNLSIIDDIILPELAGETLSSYEKRELGFISSAMFFISVKSKFSKMITYPFVCVNICKVN